MVYKAEDTGLEHLAALKFLPPQHRDRFLCEAQTAADLNHPSIRTIPGFSRHTTEGALD